MTRGDTLAGVWSYPCAEIWTALEISGTAMHPTVAAARVLRTDDRPDATAPLPAIRYLWTASRPNPVRRPTVCWTE